MATNNTNSQREKFNNTVDPVQIVIPFESGSKLSSNDNSKNYILGAITGLALLLGLPTVLIGIGAKLPPPLDLIPYLFVLVALAFGLGAVCFVGLWLYHWHLDRKERRQEGASKQEFDNNPHSDGIQANTNNAEANTIRFSNTTNEAAPEFYVVDGKVEEGSDFWQIANHPYLQPSSGGSPKRLEMGEMQKTVDYYGKQ